MGEADGVFLQVELTDIRAEEMGDTLAEDLAEYSQHCPHWKQAG